MNPLVAALAHLLDVADSTIITRGARAWKLNDPTLPVEVGVVYVRKVLNDLVKDTKGEPDPVVDPHSGAHEDV